MSFVLDAGALIAVDKGDRDTLTVLKLGRRGGGRMTVAPVVTQAWRDGARQARLAHFLVSVDVLPVDEVTARRAGELMARSGTSDAVDALLAAAARPGDVIVTSDPEDITRLVEANGGGVEVATV